MMFLLVKVFYFVSIFMIFVFFFSIDFVGVRLCVYIYMVKRYKCGKFR